MGLLAEAFEAELVRAGYSFLSKAEVREKDLANTKELPAGVRSEFQDLFRSLGGIREQVDFKAGQWDLITRGGLHIEFDEQLHFNRYRHLTAEVSWSDCLPWVPEYVQYNSLHEDACLRAGMRGKTWTSPSTEKMFGEADRPGVFGRNGSPRWKQRALYDAVRDAYAVHTPGVTMARVSLHDQIGGIGGHLLGKKGVSLDPVALREFVMKRTVPST